MTDTDEGKAALEAARVAYLVDVPGDAEDQFHSRFKAGLRAWMQALPGWWMVPVGALRGTCCETGLEQTGGGYDTVRDCSVCGGDGIDPKFKANPPGLEPDSHE